MSMFLLVGGVAMLSLGVGMYIGLIVGLNVR